MVIAALKTLTWGTIATAVGSALLLAYAGSTMPRMTGISDDMAPARAATARPMLADPRSSHAGEARHGEASARDLPAR